MRIKILIYVGCLQKEPQKRWNINEIIICLSKIEIPKSSPVPVPVPVPVPIPVPGSKLPFNQLVNPFIFTNQSELYKEMAIIRLDEAKFSNLDELNVVPDKAISFDSCWTVKKALNKETNSLVSVKYYKIIEMDFLGFMQQIPATEIHLLQAIQNIGSPTLIKFLGARRDLKPENTFKLVLLMENIEDTLENLKRVGFQGNQNEMLYILNDLVDQLVLLQQNGIACRDIKLTTIGVIKTENNKYCFKIFDFSTGCIVEQKDNYLMRIHGNIMSCTNYFASPETLIITQLTRIANQRFHQDFYDPFLSDVYSLAKNIQRLIDETKVYAELNEILNQMLVEDVEARINFFQLQEILRTPRFQKLMSSPLGLESYIQRNQDIRNFIPPPDLSDLIQNSDMLHHPGCPTQ